MSIAKLKERIVEAESQRDYYKGLVDAFFTGDIPDGASIEHVILAQYGRKRLAEKAKTPALLSKRQ